MGENESEVGLWYRKSRPLEDLPPHVVGIAHRAHRMLVNDVMPQAILIMGRAGSGKTEVARRLISQLLREARLSPRSGLGPRIIMAQHILKSLTTARTRDNPESTRGINMATLHFRSDGQLVSAELHSLCPDKWWLTDRGPGCGGFSVFYAVLAGMSDHERRLYYLTDTHSTYTDRLLNRNDSRPVFLDRADHQHHVQLFDFLAHCLHNSGIDEQTRNYAGKELSAIFAVVAAILHLGNIDVIVNPQSGRLVITNQHELASVCDLLAIGQDYLEAEIVSIATVIRGEVVRMTSTLDQAQWSRDVLVAELYRRLVSVLTARLNHHALSPESYVDHGPLTPITVVDSVAPEFKPHDSTGGLETFLRNMATERLQHHLYDVIFHRDVETCERERVTAYKIKFAHNTELISAVFGPDYGIMTKLTATCLDPEGSPESLVSLMDSDRSLRKNASYVHTGKAVKGADVFFIKHAGLGQVTYTSRDFVIKNRSSLPESARQMLIRCQNPLVPALAAPTFHESGFPQDMSSPDALFATRSFQSDLTYLLQTLDSANLHHIRCLKASDGMTPGQFDSQTVTEQLKECCVVETARQRKFGFAAVLTQEQFVRNYRDLAYSTFSRVTKTAEACKVILQKAGLHGRGVTLSKTSVFLRYWHVHRLHALKADHMRKIVTVQAHVRGFLMRKRFRQMMASYGARRGMQQPTPAYPNSAAYPYPGGQQGQVRALGRQESEDIPEYPEYVNGSGRNYPGYAGDFPRHVDDDSESAIVADDPSGLYSTIIDKVLSSLHTLEGSTWAKVIYLERGKQVAKVYAEERSVIVDGSHADFDGDRLGLGMCRNRDRDEETAFYRSRIVEGVRLKHDTDDSISACRLSEQHVLVKGLGNLNAAGGGGGGCCFSEDVLLNGGQLPFEKTIKIFDMKEFHSKIALDLKHHSFSKAKMRRACVVGLAFGRDDADDSQTPCWLCVVNVKALVALESEGILQKAQRYTAELQMTSPEAEERKQRASDAKTRHERERWSRVDQRQHLQEKEEGGRHVRHKLRAKGLPVGDHVGYSWDQPGTEERTVQDLQDWAEPQYNRNSRRKSRDSGQGRDWAKVETVVRDEKKSLGMVGRSMSGLSDAGY
ncbi:myosin-IIIa-like [Babylonia areolata]|uniref:myosin-IIIa-like n=1 Tax=Babylonia areolata TaxID=304850 RepID=UPI003FD4288B